MRFTTPLALLLLLSLPYFVWLARPLAGGRRRLRGWLSLATRLAIVALIVLALAGTQVARAADNLAVVFLVDASDSITPPQRAEADTFIREAIENLAADDQAAVVVFGANALVERPMSGLARLAPITSVPQTLGTDLAEAVRLGLALFPPGHARRLVLLSDGAATSGDALEAARVAAAAGVRLDVVPLLSPAATAEALITAVDAPTRIVRGETFRLTVTAESTGNQPATLRILAGGVVIAEEVVQLRPGVNNITTRLRAAAPEFARYTVQLEPTFDTLFQNNQLAAFTEVVGPPRILLVAAAAGEDADGDLVVDESPPLRQALEAAGLQVERTTPAALTTSLAELSSYASIVLVDVNAKQLAPRNMEALQTAVRELGSGLVVVGGPESYGMGGYFRTPLEETLPVDMQIKDQERFPAVSIVIVIDRSGSMGASEGGVSKIQLAAEGAVRVVELLNDFDEIAVIPVDTRPDNPIGPLPAADKGPIIERIRQLGAGGGGIYVRTGLEAAADALAASANPIQHIIVLADGADSEQKEGVPELIDVLTASGVTVSFVSIGNGPDVPWLQQMAARGNGRFHFTDRAANLPQIFTQETTSIQRSYLIEERFFPTLAGRSPILAGISTVPPLYGYVGTTAKDTAQVILETHLGDPLLAAWQYGLGRSVAWTSDATGRWAAEWVPWAGFPAFWAQAVRWTTSPDRDNSAETGITLVEDEARIRVDARDADGALLNNLSLVANVISPDGVARPIPLDQVAPGRYAGRFVPTTEGAYLIRLSGGLMDAGEDGPTIGQTTGWVLGYSPEYRLAGPDPVLLAALAAETGGRDLRGDPLAAIAHDLPATTAVRPIWPWLLLVATVLLPADVALRRLVIGRADLARAGAAVARRLWPRRASPAPRAERVTRLFQAKERAGRGREPAPPEAPLETPPPPVPAGEAARPGAPTGEAAPDAADDTLAARLRQRRESRNRPSQDASPPDQP